MLNELKQAVDGQVDQHVNEEGDDVGNPQPMGILEDGIREEPNKRPKQWGSNRVKKLFEATGITRSGQLQHDLERHHAIGEKEQIIRDLPETLQNTLGA